MEVSKRKPVILLVEDNPGDVRLLRELLRDAGDPFELETSHLLSEALKLLETQVFSLVLLDLMLPDCRGIDTFRRVGACAPQVPLIVLSGLHDEELALQTVREGAQDYLVKGQIDHRILVRAIFYAIKRHEADRALAQERNLLRSVIDNLRDAIYVKDRAGRYLLDNAAHRRLLGVSRAEEVTLRTAYDFFPEAFARQIDAEDQQVIATGKPIINREAPYPGRGEGERWMSSTIVPLRDMEGELVGVVGIGRDITERRRAQAQLERYHLEIRERNTELEEDLQMAREIQQAFLPQQFPNFPLRASAQESALHFYSRYIPTTAVGGDFFHILPISDTQAGVFICDVMGHGVRAALVTAIQRALVEEMMAIAHDPGRLLSALNDALLSILRRVRTPMFASAFYLVVDLEEGVLRYASAGHPSPVHFHHDTGHWHLLHPDQPGPALGVFPGMGYATRSCAAHSHDLVLLFTDGLYEVEGPDGEYFDQDRLLSLFEHHNLGGPGGVEELVNTTLEEVRQFSRDHEFIDDVCLVAVEIERVPEGSVV